MTKPTQETIETFKKLTSPSQFKCVLELMRGEEGQFFAETINRVADIWANTPKTYETDGQDKTRLARLHYYTCSADWWIIEKDSDTDGEGQIQAFGIADLGMGCREYGYISLVEILEVGAELDFHFTPMCACDIMKGGK